MRVLRAQRYVAENPRTSGLAIAAAVLVLAGIGVGIYFLARFWGKKDDANSDSDAHSAGSSAFGDDGATPDATDARCPRRCRGSAETRNRRCGVFGWRSS